MFWLNAADKSCLLVLIIVPAVHISHLWYNTEVNTSTSCDDVVSSTCDDGVESLL